MDYIEIQPDLVPMALLLEADPSEECIRSYLVGSLCFVAMDSDLIIAASIVKPITDKIVEIFNISVYPNFQNKGIGSDLLRFTLSQLSEKGVQRVELGTGSFGYQLTYYQRFGFRVDAVIKDYFLDNYPEPIYENGLQHKDMLRLTVSI